MKETGVVRKIDKLGRIVVPKEVRDELGIKVRDPVEIYVEEDTIVLKKYSTKCIICQNKENISYYKGKPICKNCKTELSDL